MSTETTELRDVLAVAMLDKVMSTLIERKLVPTTEVIDQLLDVRKFLSSPTPELPIGTP